MSIKLQIPLIVGWLSGCVSKMKQVFGSYSLSIYLVLVMIIFVSSLWRTETDRGTYGWSCHEIKCTYIQVCLRKVTNVNIGIILDLICAFSVISSWLHSEFVE
ncbi:unnamed protein product [Linum trigynum]|uniref:Uncharacterized protein n=1 Tax=Linum trigynum TaxID=586398 RepID=A0AAV2F8I5_9ROSI